MPRRLAHDWFPRDVPSHVALDASSWCYSTFAFLHSRNRRSDSIVIGHHSGIYNGTFFDTGPDADVRIGDYTTLVGAIISTNGKVTIGDCCFLAHEVVLADREVAVPGPDHPTGTGGITLGDNCWIGMRAVIVGPVTIGEGAIIGAFAVVREDVPPFAVVAGNPARITGWAKPS